MVSGVSFAPISTRPWHYEGVEDEPEDCVCALSVGPPFTYVIPSFDLLRVELRQMCVKAYTAQEGEEKQYDFFIRNSQSLCRSYPAWMIVKDATIVKVRGCYLAVGR